MGRGSRRGTVRTPDHLLGRRKIGKVQADSRLRGEKEMVCDEETIRRASAEELREMRLWLFKESVRLENEQVTLDLRFDELERFQMECEKELKADRAKVERDRKLLEEDRDLFNKRLDILHKGFDELTMDRKKLEREWVRLETEKGIQSEKSFRKDEVFFRGAEGPLAIRKRYKDLMKIYHPDNLHGDHEVVDMINDEYNQLMRPYAELRKA